MQIKKQRPHRVLAQRGMGVQAVGTALPSPFVVMYIDLSMSVRHMVLLI